MGRGSNSQVKLAEQQLNTDNARTAQLMAEREKGRSILQPMALADANSSGYSPAEKNAMMGGSLEAADSAYDAGQQQMENRTARTHNSAGGFANLLALSKSRAENKSDIVRGEQQQFADEAQKRRLAGKQLLANMYGIDTNLLGNVAGLPAQDLNQRMNGYHPTSIKVGDYSYSG